MAAKKREPVRTRRVQTPVRPTVELEPFCFEVAPSKQQGERIAAAAARDAVSIEQIVARIGRRLVAELERSIAAIERGSIAPDGLTRFPWGGRSESLAPYVLELFRDHLEDPRLLPHVRAEVRDAVEASARRMWHPDGSEKEAEQLVEMAVDRWDYLAREFAKRSAQPLAEIAADIARREVSYHPGLVPLGLAAKSEVEAAATIASWIVRLHSKGTRGTGRNSVIASILGDRGDRVKDRLKKARRRAPKL